MTLQQISTEASWVIAASQANFLLLLKLMGILWAVNVVNWLLFHSAFNGLGIRPRKVIGLPGIWLNPIFHGDFNHLFFNSIPLFILANLMMLEGMTRFTEISMYIISISGFIIWLVGRRGIHIGASTLIMGYFGYLLAAAYYKPSILGIMLAGVSLYYFAGLLLGLFPSEERVSWEGHFAGFCTGIGVAYYFL